MVPSLALETGVLWPLMGGRFLPGSPALPGVLVPGEGGDSLVGSPDIQESWNQMSALSLSCRVTLRRCLAPFLSLSVLLWKMGVTNPPLLVLQGSSVMPPL